MKKRICLNDSIAIALLYRKIYADTDILLFDKVLYYQKIVSENLESMNSTCGLSNKFKEYDFELFTTLKDEKGDMYAVINKDIDMEKMYNKYIKSLPEDMLIATQMPNALNIINLKKEDSKTLLKKHLV